MEKNIPAELPGDMWKVVLAFVDDIYTLVALKRVSRSWRREILAQKLLESINNQPISAEMISYFTKRKISESVPLPTDFQPLFPPSVLIVPFTSLKEQKIELSNLFLTQQHQLLNGGSFQTSKGVEVNIRLPRRYESHSEIAYWIGCSGGLFLFALDDRSAFLNLVSQWISFCYNKRQSMQSNIVYYLIGLAPKDKSKFQVSKREIQLLADLFGLKYFEVESGTTLNLVPPLKFLCEDMVDAHLAPELTEDLRTDSRCTIM